MKLITIEDIRDIYIKFQQRGLAFLLSKLHVSATAKTKSSFNDTTIDVSYWNQHPMVRRRWNEFITGDKDLRYEEYLSQKYFRGKRLKILGIGSGVCSHELFIAQLNPNCEVTCIDFSDKLLGEAKQTAEEKKITNIKFVAEDIYKVSLPQNYYDVVFFHSSLHHFDNLFSFLRMVKGVLVENGLLVINEYVGPTRLQYSKEQIDAINSGLKTLPDSYKKIYKSNLIKKHYYGSGVLRMYLSDPSECVDSSNILPAARHYFRAIEEKRIGGNILMPLLKDIVHNFSNPEGDMLLERLFEYEDKYLESHESDFVFGVYKKCL